MPSNLKAPHPYSVKLYFDANATTRPCAEALAARSEVDAEFWQNPSGLYPDAAAAHRRLEDARESLADLLGCDEPERIIFTSGATEANNAVFAYYANSGEPGARVLIGKSEHPSVREPARRHFGSNAVEIGSDHSGIVLLDALLAELDLGKVALVSVMAANNETGVIQPWREVRDLCHESGVPIHCDAAQWLGKQASSDIGQCALLTGSAHKFRGPKGVGFLVAPEDSPILLQIGGPQEQSRRAGTENLAGIASMVAALGSTLEATEKRREPMAKARDRFEADVTARIPGTLIAGKEADRLWNTSMLIMPDQGNLRWITRLGKLGVAASTGSACSAGRGKPSLTLGAMGFDFEQMGRALRFSADWETTVEDWAALANALADVWTDLNQSPKRSGRGNTLSRPGF